MPQQTDFEMKIGIREVFYEGAQNQLWEVKEAMLSQQRPSHLHGDWHVPSQLPYIDIRGQELITTHLPVIGCGLPTTTYLQWDMILGKAALLPIIPADETMFFESLKWRTGKVYHRITLGHSESLFCIIYSQSTFLSPSLPLKDTYTGKARTIISTSSPAVLEPQSIFIFSLLHFWWLVKVESLSLCALLSICGNSEGHSSRVSHANC